jgi:hypothetical protein
MQNVSVLICRTTPTYFRVVDIYLGIEGEAHNVVNAAELISRQLLRRIDFFMSSVLLIILMSAFLIELLFVMKLFCRI